MSKYNLFIRRYGRSMDFDSLAELKEEVGRYFTEREKHIVERLCCFTGNPDTGVITNSYQDFSVSFYPENVLEK